LSMLQTRAIHMVCFYCFWLLRRKERESPTKLRGWYFGWPSLFWAFKSSGFGRVAVLGRLLFELDSERHPGLGAVRTGPKLRDGAAPALPPHHRRQRVHQKPPGTAGGGGGGGGLKTRMEG
jgi:hypothetical protein